MERIFTTIIGLVFINGIWSKELHIKEDLDLKHKEVKDIINLLNSNDDILYDPNNERFARHLEVVTESVLTHFMAQLKHQIANTAPTRKTPYNPMMNLLRRIKTHVQRKDRKKMMRNKKNKTENKGKRRRLSKLIKHKLDDSRN